MLLRLAFSLLLLLEQEELSVLLRSAAMTQLKQQAVQRCTIRQAVLGAQVRVPVHKALGRVCAMPTVSCPPAIPVAVSGEEITPAAIALMQRYGIEELSVLR